MKVIIAGSRELTNSVIIPAAVEASGFVIVEVVSGTARGIDRLGELWAIENDIPIKQFPADWQEHGRAAGHICNKQMADYADALIAIWDYNSSGTANMITTAKRQDLKVFVYPQ